MKSVRFLATAIGCAVAAAASTGSAAVIGATVADASSGNYTLTSVSVNRSGTTHTYVPSTLTGVNLTDVAAFATPLLVPGNNAALPASGTRANLLGDWRLDSGVIEPFSIAGGTLDSFEVTFDKPVVNSVGEDILAFDVGGLETTFFYINNDDSQAGNTASPQRVAPADFARNLLQVNYSLFSYNNGGDQNVNDLAELESPVGYAFLSNGTGVGVSAVGLDLTDFGVAPGATISSLRFQAVSGRIDPVLIVGLPAVPEPAGMALLSLGGLALLRRKRSSGG
ncbi:MAG TPA: PEP-CTERM sorting domain-containing protein [Tepidisphaeraceae bacterium]|nr:PEP-CTERM sorting domain-containing protein [Tepidisphaeraceae bacterium]